MSEPYPLVTVEVETVAPPLPGALAELSHLTFVQLRRNYPVPSRVFRLERDGQPIYYLKVGTRLVGERDRLLWLEGRLPVPRVAGFERETGCDYLLTTAIRGRPADTLLQSCARRTLPGRIAQALATVAAVEVTDCRFDACTPTLLTAAEESVAAGAVSRAQLSKRYRDSTPKQLLERAWALCPPECELAFTHGDFCLPNVIVGEDGSVAFVDVGCAGVGDPRRDLALALRSLHRNGAGELADLLARAFPARADARSLEFFLLLDQLIIARGDGATAGGAAG